MNKITEKKIFNTIHPRWELNPERSVPRPHNVSTELSETLIQGVNEWCNENHKSKTKN